MVLARVANLFTNGDASHSRIADDGQSHGARTVQAVELPMADTTRSAIAESVDEEEARPPYLHVRKPRPRRWDSVH